MLDDRDADAVEARILVFFKFFEFAVGEVSGVWIERREHALDCGLGCFLVIDVAGVVGRDGRDGFVIVAFDFVGDAIRVLGCAD